MFYLFLLDLFLLDLTSYSHCSHLIIVVFAMPLIWIDGQFHQTDEALHDARMMGTLKQGRVGKEQKQPPSASDLAAEKEAETFHFVPKAKKQKHDLRAEKLWLDHQKLKKHKKVSGGGEFEDNTAKRLEYLSKIPLPVDLEEMFEEETENDRLAALKTQLRINRELQYLKEQERGLRAWISRPTRMSYQHGEEYSKSRQVRHRNASRNWDPQIRWSGDVDDVDVGGDPDLRPVKKRREDPGVVPVQPESHTYHGIEFSSGRGRDEFVSIVSSWQELVRHFGYSVEEIMTPGKISDIESCCKPLTEWRPYVMELLEEAERKY